MAEVGLLTLVMDYSGFSKYLQEIGNFHPLDRKHEARLWRIVQLGMREKAGAAQRAASIAAQQELIQRNLKLVLKIARCYRSPIVPIEELVCAGNHGLVTAAERFKPERRVRFSTFAGHWIRLSMWLALQSSYLIRPPYRYLFETNRIRRSKSFNEDGFEQDIDKLHEETGLSKRRILQMLIFPKVFISLHGPPTAGVEMTMEEAIASDSQTPAEILQRKEEIQLVRKCVRDLQPFQRRILLARRVFTSPKRPTLDSLAKRLGSSRKSIRQTEKNALRILRMKLRQFGM